MKKKLVISFLVLLCSVVSLFVRLHPIGARIDILSDYRQLLSDPEVVRRLESTPTIRKWIHISDENEISIGYASFSFPFGEIYEISETSRGVCIDSDKAQVKFVFSMLKDFAVDLEHPEEQLPGLTYAGGEIKVRDKKYQDYDIALNELEFSMPSYEFHRKIQELKPKSIFSMLLMDFDNLYLYEKMLEMKNAEFWGGDVFLFETDDLKGSVERLNRVEDDGNYASCYVILIWDKGNEIYQLVQLKSYVDEITEQQIQQFVSSLSYDIDVINSNSENIRPVIIDALKQNAYYVSDVEIEQETLFTGD